jgi:hypothetical protein
LLPTPHQYQPPPPPYPPPEHPPCSPLLHPPTLTTSAPQTSTNTNRQFSSTTDSTSFANGINTQINSRTGRDSVSAQHHSTRASRNEALSFLDTIAAPNRSQTTGIVTQNQSRSDRSSWRCDRQRSLTPAGRSRCDNERDCSQTNLSAAPSLRQTTGIVPQSQSRSDGSNWRRERQRSPPASRFRRDTERNRSQLQVSHAPRVSTQRHDGARRLRTTHSRDRHRR